ncbi:MAG: hypothetical protein NVS3B12_15170 [Acidimicrobiales bacterium]
MPEESERNSHKRARPETSFSGTARPPPDEAFHLAKETRLIANCATAADNPSTSTTGPPGCDETGTPASARFRVAPPRHFPYPAILLLLLEEPRHGYRLVDSLLRFGFGPVDRPTVYRTLSDLEHDGLVTSWPAPPSAGATRQVYGVTERGRMVLEKWMGMLASERDFISGMLDRYERNRLP